MSTIEIPREKQPFGVASLVDLVEMQYARASKQNIHHVELNFSPTAEIASACSRIFAALDRDDEVQRRIASTVWRLRSTVFQTFLPFNDNRLNLAAYAAELKRQSVALGGIRSDAVALASILEDLTSNSANPKREWFQSWIADMRARREGVAVLAALQGAGTPGWPTDLAGAEDPVFHDVCLLRTRKDLRNRVFDGTVIPGTTRFTAKPLVQDLLYGGRTRDALVVTYRGERAHLPRPVTLPPDRFFGARTVTLSSEFEAQVERAEAQSDDWARHSIWQEIRTRQADMAPISERDVIVSARFVLFADGTGTFLPEDRRVVEISELLDSGGALNGIDDQLPRKPVRELEEGDLVLLRLAGGGHYVEDVADSLMASSGLQHLRHEATEWKEILQRTLKRRGDGYVAKAARDVGLRIRNANYLWQWAGDAVMAPHDFPTFLALMKTLFRLEPSEHCGDAHEYASKRWQQMEHVKSFHMRAGVVIRNALLERVRRFVAERTPIVTVVSVELPGLEAGRMGLLRVAAVDSSTMAVPLSRLFHFFPMKAP